MKKLSLLIILAGFAFGVKAQNAEVVNAWSALRYKEYYKAKISIDKTILDPKTGISAKTWYYRGLIYQEIEESLDANVKVIDTQSLDKATESYLKSLELDIKKAYTDDIKKRLPVLQYQYNLKGSKNFNAKHYQNAADLFMKSADISEKVFSKIDTDLIYNAALATFYNKNINGAIPLLKKVVDIGYDENNAYYLLAQSYLLTKDTVSALNSVQIGKDKYPNNKDLQNLEINIYIAKNQLNVLIDKLKKSIETDPQNKLYHLILGSTYESLANPKNTKGGDLPKPKNYSDLFNLSEKSYLAAIKLDSNLFDAYFNLGVMHYNAAVDVYNKLKDIDINKVKEYNAGKAKYTASFNKSLPYLEKALLLAPNDVNTLLSLKEVYAKLDNFTKSGEMKKRIEALKKK